MNYNEIEKNILSILEKTPNCVLATVSKNGVPSACMMSFVNDNLKVYVQTDKRFEKIKNIQENPNVALNLGAYYFKGLAKIVGKPTLNEVFIQKLKQKHPKTYASYTNLPNEVLIEISLTECKIWGINNENGEETITTVDFVAKKVYQIVCDKM